MHDIRRTFGLEVSRAAGLHVASKLLGHSTVKVTERVYAPLQEKELREAAESVRADRKGKLLEFKRKQEQNSK